ncbi:hypothetical protein [Polaromonas jejuensis]|uniref:Uncharacterized protein n=1 Tax=Polaromonas jejuensis TaxID=457502 RepID=A0ABW0QGH1_9BURK|nr:hypothetical protein [Polaromonas jejuensis]
MPPSQASTAGEFARWIEEKSEAVKVELAEKFPPVTSGPAAVHNETCTQRIEEVLLGHEAAGDALLEELATEDTVPPLSDEELARQALANGGADEDTDTPEQAA